MKCAMCFGKLIDVGDGYECRNCSYFLEYDEIDEDDDDDEENTDEYEVFYYEYDNLLDLSEDSDTYARNED